jgi:hypothetical protein
LPRTDAPSAAVGGGCPAPLEAAPGTADHGSYQIRLKRVPPSRLPLPVGYVERSKRRRIIRIWYHGTPDLVLFAEISGDGDDAAARCSGLLLPWLARGDPYRPALGGQPQREVTTHEARAAKEDDPPLHHRAPAPPMLAGPADARPLPVHRAGRAP